MKRDLRIGPNGEPILLNMRSAIENPQILDELKQYHRPLQDSISADLPSEPLIESADTEKRGLMHFVRRIALTIKKRFCHKFISYFWAKL